jgi:diguanylate cyclase
MELLNKLKNLTLNAGLGSVEEVNSLRDEVEKSNRVNLQVFSLIIVAYMGILMIAASFNSVAKVNFWYYFGECMIGILLFILSCFVNKKSYWLTMVLSYAFMISLMVFSCLIGTITITTSKAAIFPALLLLVPLLFMERPFKIDILLTLSVVLFILLGYFFKDINVFYEDLLNVIICYFASMVIAAYIQKIRYKNAWNERRLIAMSDMDVLTNMQNRNCFERQIQEYEKKENKNSQLIFVDVNGLHEINNNLGHDKGDEMLYFIAFNLKNIFGEDYCYRIGGDEFIVLYVDNFDDKIQEKINTFRSIIELKDYHVSIGYEKAKEHVFDYTELTKMAETLMYQEKKEYYQKNNIVGSIR